MFNGLEFKKKDNRFDFYLDESVTIQVTCFDNNMPEIECDYYFTPRVMEQAARLFSSLSHVINAQGSLTSYYEEYMRNKTDDKRQTISIDGVEYVRKDA